MSSVVIDGYGGAKMQAEHVLALGHRNFAIAAVQRRPVEAIFHPPGRKQTKLQNGFQLDHLKLRGYADALSAVGISIHDVPIVEAFPPSPFAELGAALLLDRAPKATAVLAMADKNALTVLQEARSRGIRVPQDLSVIGFDDVEDAATATPPLTTIAQQIAEKGRTAARMLFRGALPRQEILPVMLVTRGSVAPPRDG